MTEWIDWIPLFWLALAILLITIELESLNLITIWFALGSIAAMLVALYNPELLFVQIVVFIVVSLVVLVTIRDLAVKKFKVGSVKTNVSALLGRKVIVTRQIEEYAFGEVKVDGNYWTAKTLAGDTIMAGEEVEIVEISGVKLIVKKINKI